MLFIIFNLNLHFFLKILWYCLLFLIDVSATGPVQFLLYPSYLNGCEVKIISHVKGNKETEDTVNGLKQQ